MWPMRLLLACALCLQGAAAQVTGCSVTNLTQVVGTRAAIGAPCAGQAEVDVGTVCPFTSAGETCHPVTCSSTAPVGVSWDLPTTVCYAGGCTMSALDLSDVQTAGGVGTSMLCRTASGAVSDGTMCRFTVAGGVQQCEAPRCAGGVWTIPNPKCYQRADSCWGFSAQADLHGASPKAPHYDGSLVPAGQSLTLQRGGKDCSPVTCASGQPSGAFSSTASCPPGGQCDAALLTLAPAAQALQAQGILTSPTGCLGAAGPVMKDDNFQCIFTAGLPSVLKCRGPYCVDGKWEESVSCGCKVADVVVTAVGQSGDVEPSHGGVVPVDTVVRFIPDSGACSSVTCSATGWSFPSSVCQAPACSVTTFNNMGFTSMSTPSAATCMDGNAVAANTACSVVPRDRALLGLPATGGVLCDTMSCDGNDWVPRVPRCEAVADACLFDTLPVAPASVVSYTGSGCAAGYLVHSGTRCAPSTSGTEEACHKPRCTGNDVFLPRVVECFVKGCSTDAYVDNVPAGAVIDATASDENCAADHAVRDGAVCTYRLAGKVCTTHTCKAGSFSPHVARCVEGCRFDDVSAPLRGESVSGTGCVDGGVVELGQACDVSQAGKVVWRMACTATGWLKKHVCHRDDLDLSKAKGAANSCTSSLVEEGTECTFTLASATCTPTTCTPTSVWTTGQIVCTVSCDAKDATLNAGQTLGGGCTGQVAEGTSCTVQQGTVDCDGAAKCTNGGVWDMSNVVCEACAYDTLVVDGAQPQGVGCTAGGWVADAGSCTFEKAGQACSPAVCKMGVWDGSPVACDVDECKQACAAPLQCVDPNKRVSGDWKCTCANGAATAVGQLPDCTQCVYDSLQVGGATPQDTAVCGAGKLVGDGVTCIFTQQDAVCTPAKCTAGQWDTPAVVCVGNTPAPDTSSPQTLAPATTPVPQAANTPPSVTCKSGEALPCPVAVLEDNSAVAQTGQRVRLEGTGVVSVSPSTPAGLAGEAGQSVSAACTCAGAGAAQAGCTATLDTVTGSVGVEVEADTAEEVRVECTLTDTGAAGLVGGPVAVAVVKIEAVNDVPTGEVAAAQTAVAVGVGGAVGTNVSVREAGWATGVGAGPVTATDEAQQTVRGDCEGDLGVFAAPPVMEMVGQEAALVYTVKGDAAAGVSAITCKLVDGGGARLQLPPVQVEVRRVGVTWPADEQQQALKSEAINTADGSVLHIRLTGTQFPATGAVPFAVAGPGLAEPLRFGNGEPLLTLQTDKGTADATRGLLATLGGNGTAPDAPFVSVSVSADRQVLEVRIQSPDYLLVSPDEERLSLSLSPSAFGVRNGADMCAAGGQQCAFDTTVRPATTQLPNQAELTETREVATAAVGAASSVLATGASTGTKSGILALTSRAMLCPGDGPDKLDRTLNPLGLVFGHDDYKEYNGAVVGSIIINTGLLLICTAAGVWMYRRIRMTRHVKFVLRHKGEAAALIDLRYVMLKARFGWLLVPFCFLYGGAVVGVVTALMYSGVGFKFVAALVCLTFVLALPYYAFSTARASNKYSEVVDIANDDGTPLKWYVVLFWGRREWAPCPALPGAHTWTSLHHLVFDGYSPAWRYFLVVEMGTMLLLGIITAWQPGSRTTCWARAIMMTCVLGLYTLLLCVACPFLAMYENVMESLIALSETLMMVFTCVAMGTDNPTRHWGADAAGNLGLAAMYLIIVKFVIDTAVFVLDEYHDWVAQGGSGTVSGFLLYWFCFVGSLEDDLMHSKDKQPDHEEGEELMDELTTVRDHDAVKHPYFQPDEHLQEPRSGGEDGSESSIGVPMAPTSPFIGSEASDSFAFRGRGAIGPKPAVPAYRNNMRGVKHVTDSPAPPEEGKDGIIYF